MMGLQGGKKFHDMFSNIDTDHEYDRQMYGRTDLIATAHRPTAIACNAIAL